MHLSHAARAVGAVRAVGRAHRAPRCPVPCGNASSTRAARCWHAQPTCALAPMCTVPEPARRSRPPLLLPVHAGGTRSALRWPTSVYRYAAHVGLHGERAGSRTGACTGRKPRLPFCALLTHACLSAPCLPSARGGVPRVARAPLFSVARPKLPRFHSVNLTFYLSLRRPMASWIRVQSAPNRRQMFGTRSHIARKLAPAAVAAGSSLCHQQTCVGNKTERQRPSRPPRRGSSVHGSRLRHGRRLITLKLTMRRTQRTLTRGAEQGTEVRP